MLSPYLNTADTSAVYTSTFAGLNRRARIGDGEFAEMVNMSSDNYPLLSPRKPRMIAQEQLTKEVETETEDGETVTETVGMALNGILGDVGFAAVWGGEFHYMGKKVDGINLLNGEKDLVAMGANILIFPDAVWYNTVDGTHGEIDDGSVYTRSGIKIHGIVFADDDIKSAGYTDENYHYLTITLPYEHDGTTETTDVRFRLTRKLSAVDSIADRKIGKYEIPSILFYKGALYVPSRVSEDSNYCYCHDYKPRKSFVTVYKSNVPAFFDSVGSSTWSGSVKVEVRGGNSYLVNTDAVNVDSGKGTFSVNWKQKKLPVLDHVCVLNNRLWGCRYGYQVSSEGMDSVVNEIYCSKLGDFKTWTLTSSTSTLAGDPWTASLGEYGAWTGCIAHRGYVLFFKENCIFRVSGTKPSNFSYKTIAAEGLTEPRSMAIIDEVLYYKGRNGVYAYDGSLPTRISDKLGDAEFAEGAVGGAIYGKYYLNMGGHTYVYDTRTGLWHEGGAERVQFFARSGGCLYGGIGNRIVAFAGSPLACFASEREGAVEWSAETGDIGMESPYQKWYKGFTIRYVADIGARMVVEISTDGGAFHRVADVTGDSMRTMNVQVCTPRCDHMRIRFSGKGDVKIYSIFYEMETASLMPERKL